MSKRAAETDDATLARSPKRAEVTAETKAEYVTEEIKMWREAFEKAVVATQQRKFQDICYPALPDYSAVVDYLNAKRLTPEQVRICSRIARLVFSYLTVYR